MPDLRYPALIDEVAPGEFLVSFRDVPEVVTGGATRAESFDLAVDALAVAIEGYLLAGSPVPAPSPAGRDEDLVPLQLPIAARVLLTGEMLRQGVSGRALADRMGRDEKNVRRILQGKASLDLTLDALRRLGVRPALTASIPEAA